MIANDYVVRLSRTLPFAVAWGLTPCGLMVISGVLLKLDGAESILAMVVHLAGFWGGIPLLSGWALWLLRDVALLPLPRFLVGAIIAMGAWVINVILAIGACSIINPPLPGEV